MQRLGKSEGKTSSATRTKPQIQFRSRDFGEGSGSSTIFSSLQEVRDRIEGLEYIMMHRNAKTHGQGGQTQLAELLNGQHQMETDRDIKEEADDHE